MAQVEMYKGYRIQPADYVPAARFAWEYCHEDYDGLEDGRYGLAASPEACRAEIDEANES